MYRIMNLSTFRKNLLWLIKPFHLLLTQIRLTLWIVITASLLLSGCVHSDLGVSFENAHNGELIQHIKLTDNFTAFSGNYIDEWLETIDRRARKLEGSTIRVNSAEIIVKIPFSDAKELQEKFQGFFNFSRLENSKLPDKEAEFTDIKSNLALEQNNFLFVVRNRLIYDLDLRAIALVTGQDKVGSILDLDFTLQTPWGAKNIASTSETTPPEKNGNQLIWKLQPGELNHLEAIFWLPSPLGIGTLFIILFIWGGLYLRYSFMSNPRIEFAPKTP